MHSRMVGVGGYGGGDVVLVVLVDVSSVVCAFCEVSAVSSTFSVTAASGSKRSVSLTAVLYNNVEIGRLEPVVAANVRELIDHGRSPCCGGVAKGHTEGGQSPRTTKIAALVYRFVLGTAIMENGEELFKTSQHGGQWQRDWYCRDGCRKRKKNEKLSPTRGRRKKKSNVSLNAKRLRFRLT